MRKSDKLTEKLNRAEQLIEQARTLVLQVIDADETGDGCTGGQVNPKFDDLVDFLGEVGYEVIMPMQMEEEDREQEIERLRARLSQLETLQG